LVLTKSRQFSRRSQKKGIRAQVQSRETAKLDSEQFRGSKSIVLQSPGPLP